jgi:hypothetical protein
MVIGHGVITFRIGALADEFKCLARSKVFIGITAAINSGGRRRTCVVGREIRGQATRVHAKP